MNKIERIIKEKCSTGIKYKNIKDICLQNFWVMPSTPKYQPEGIPYITSKNIKNGKILFDDIKYITPNDFNNISNTRPICVDDILISMIGTIGEIGIVEKDNLPFYGQNMYLLRLNKNIISIKYFYYYFTSSIVKNRLLKEKNNGNQGYLKTKNIEYLKIPVPSLEVQEEIVKILDKFSKLEINLEEKLAKELRIRNCQYNFWLSKLVDKKEKIYQLSEIASIYDGTHSTPNYQLSGIPFISVENINDIYSSKKFISKEDYNKYKIKPQLNDIFMTRIGSIGKCSVLEKKIDLAYYVSLALIRPNTQIIKSKYLKYYIESYIGQEELRMKTLIHAVPIKINKDDIGKINILVPSLEEQERIINILDRFEKLTNNISISLQTEIEIRRKQYEYYKNKLLNFEELSNE